MVRIAVFISGGGTTLRNLIRKCEAGLIPVDIVRVLSSRADARGLRFAADANIPADVVKKSPALSDDDYSRAVFQPCRDANVDLVVMGGFLKHVLIPPDFEGRVMNVHPSLIPSFCGTQMYGLRVHQAALDYGVKLSGCTVHFVNNQYDNGPIILQKSCPVQEDDTAEKLSARVFDLECEALPEAIRLFAENRLQIVGRTVNILKN